MINTRRTKMLKRLQIIVFLIILGSVLYFTSDFWESWFVGWISIIFSLSAFFIGLVIFLENRNPTNTITWLVVLGTFPIIGFFFYLMFGQNLRKRKSFTEKAIKDEQAFHQIEGTRPIDESRLNEMPVYQQQLFRLAQKLAHTPISFHTNTKVLTDGKETFSYIKKALQNAKDHIHMEYYIVRGDQIGQEIKEILIQKAKAGVTVRFLYDAVGSWKLSNDFVNELNNAGVQMVPFSPVKMPLFNHRINYRNHRKIIVVDTKYGFIGGLNIGDEYLGKNRYFGHWRDTHLFVEGEAIRSLQLIFLRDWQYATNETVLKQSYLSPSLPMDTTEGGVQIIASGPDMRWEIIKKLFFKMITTAKSSIWIASPYFIPDEDMLSALKIASLSGVDVRLLVPSKADKRIVFYASRSYFPELLDAGVKIYEYHRGFMHSKLIIS